jgi:hypothetical protein
MRAACYDDASAYLGDCPHQSSPYTVCYVALVRNIRQRVDAKAADDYVTASLLAEVDMDTCTGLLTIGQTQI